LHDRGKCDNRARSRTLYARTGESFFQNGQNRGSVRRARSTLNAFNRLQVFSTFSVRIRPRSSVIKPVFRAHQGAQQFVGSQVKIKIKQWFETVASAHV
tara:strand:- start:2933 stop:3229 length:297 start_codon:yes stop_codon:yes gene_type:complete